MTVAPSSPVSPPAADAQATTDAIGAWLDRLLRITRLPRRETDEIREELDAHLRERVRDLMLAGHEEPDAIHRSIAELGDLALLAQRYRDAHRTPKGRMIMNIVLISTACAALGVSTVALQQTQPEAGLPGAGGMLSLERTPGVARDPEAVPMLSGIPVVGRLFSETQTEVALLDASIHDSLLGEVLSFLAEASDSQLYVYWNELELVGIDAETEVDYLPLENQSVAKALDMLSDAMQVAPSERFDFRVENGLMEVSTRQFFDKRELELVSYDAGTLLEASSALETSIESETLVSLVTQLIEPEMWETNGGYATVNAAGNRLFVNAPRRIHLGVEWLLGELAEGQDHARALDAATGFIAQTLTAADPRPLADVAAADVLRAASATGLTADASPEVAATLRNAVAQTRARLESPPTQPTATIYSLSHTQPGDLIPILRAALGDLGGTVDMYARGNGLMVSGDERAQRVARRIIELLDRPADARPEPGNGEAPLGAVEHTVRVGESLHSIAVATYGDGSMVDSILDANPGVEARRLAAGQRLLLPRVER